MTVCENEKSMNACEEEILRLTGYKPRKKYKCYQEYLICLLREIHNLPYDKFTYLVSHQVYEWYKEASHAFKHYWDLPKLPDVAKEELRYPRDDEEYIPPEEAEATPEEHHANIKALLAAEEKAKQALKELHEASEKTRIKTYSKYRPAHPLEGARWYLFPETDRYGLMKGTKWSRAAEMLERGCYMKEIVKLNGYHCWKLISGLRRKGHRVVNVGGMIKLTHKDDVELIKNKGEG